MVDWLSVPARPSLGDERSVSGFLYRYGEPHARSFVIGFVTTVLSQFPRLLPGLVLGVALDAIFRGTRPYALPLVPSSWIPPSEGGQLLFTVLVLGGAYALSAVLDWTARRTFNRFRYRLVHDVRVDTFRRLQAAPLSLFERRQTGDLMSVLTNDVDVAYRFARDGLMSGARFLAFGAATFGYLALVNWQLAATVLVVPVAVVLVSARFTSVVERKHDAVRERLGTLNARLETNLAGIPVVKAFGREDAERRRIADASADVRDARWDLVETRAAYHPLLSSLTGSARAGVLFVGGTWILFGAPAVYAGAFSVGELFTFLVFVGSMVGPFRQLATMGDTYQESRSAIERILELTGEARREPAESSAVRLRDPDGSVEFEDVAFAYPDADRPALASVSFSADPGATVGIVGPSGAGKSTLVELLPRFYDVDEGAVRVDGRDVRSVDRESLRTEIGFVEQESVLFEGTVAENVAYGVDDPDRDAVVRAAERAQAHEFVQSLPEGYDTRVGERGGHLSGGQRQRICLARALYGDPTLLLLDEATSHVDSETEAFIQRELREMGGERTTFVVAHRLSTVTDADLILVVENGRIVERGTHDELLAADGLYARLWRAQMGSIGDVDGALRRTSGRQAGWQER